MWLKEFIQGGKNPNPKQPNNPKTTQEQPQVEGKKIHIAVRQCLVFLDIPPDMVSSFTVINLYF